MIDTATDIHRVPMTAITPGRDEVLANQGIPRGASVPARVDELLEGACELLARVASPIGIVQAIAHADFAAVYMGEGQNEFRTPVAEIYPRAEMLALFAVTLGAAVSREIDARFETDDLALAAMLDSAASVAADGLAAAVEARWAEAVRARWAGEEPLAVLRYSPGYCGWHISGQRRLFHALRPERIDIALGASCLMQPLKSVSGVLIAGTRRIHAFKDDYPFCEQCETHGCRERLRALFAAAGREA